MSQNKLKHRVVFYSSEDTGYLANELNNSSASSKGWLSSRFPEFPQEIGFELLSSNSHERNLHLTQVQILSHQSKIATKIEIFVGVGSDYQSSSYKRLGFLSLDSNERSSYQARELKTVYVDQIGNFLKLRIQKNYLNDQNPFNQVGLMAVTFFGDEVSGGGQPSSSLSGITHPSNSSTNNVFGIEVKLDSSTLAKLKLLADAKTKAVQNEDFNTAKSIKSIESELKELANKLASLDLSKKEAVMAEDYDLASELKSQGDEYRKIISTKVCTSFCSVTQSILSYGLI
jgi:centrosomal protein CEP104